jgi:predicted nucleotidyltransferase
MPGVSSATTATWTFGLRFVDLAEHIEAILGVRSEVVSRRAIKPRNWEVIERELIDVA